MKKVKIRIVLDVTLVDENGRDVAVPPSELRDDILGAVDRCINEGMLTAGHEDLLVDEYGLKGTWKQG